MDQDKLKTPPSPAGGFRRGEGPHPDGMTVSDGYFADFAAKMQQSLPHMDFEEQPQTSSSQILAKAAPSRWHQVRPYVYMAAMFAGAWCLLKMFTLISPGANGAQYTFDTDPVVAEAVSNDQFIDYYYIDGYDEYADYPEDAADSSYEPSAQDLAMDDALGDAAYFPGDAEALGAEP